MSVLMFSESPACVESFEEQKEAVIAAIVATVKWMSFRCWNSLMTSGNHIPSRHAVMYQYRVLSTGEVPAVDYRIQLVRSEFSRYSVL